MDKKNMPKWTTLSYYIMIIISILLYFLDSIHYIEGNANISKIEFGIALAGFMFSFGTYAEYIKHTSFRDEAYNCIFHDLSYATSEDFATNDISFTKLMEHWNFVKRALFLFVITSIYEAYQYLNTGNQMNLVLFVCLLVFVWNGAVSFRWYKITMRILILNDALQDDLIASTTGREDNPHKKARLEEIEEYEKTNK